MGDASVVDCCGVVEFLLKSSEEGRCFTQLMIHSYAVGVKSILGQASGRYLFRNCLKYFRRRSDEGLTLKMIDDSQLYCGGVVESRNRFGVASGQYVLKISF